MRNSPPKCRQNEHGQTTALQYCSQWLYRAGLQYGAAGRAALARAHPQIFGSEYHLALTGYSRWLSRSYMPDTIESFARYVSSRYDLWRQSIPYAG